MNVLGGPWGVPNFLCLIFETVAHQTVTLQAFTSIHFLSLDLFKCLYLFILDSPASLNLLQLLVTLMLNLGCLTSYSHDSFHVKCLMWLTSPCCFLSPVAGGVSVMFKCSLCSWKFGKKRERRRNVLCTFNSSQALLSPSDLFILCLWSLLVKADPNDVGVGQRKASWTGLHCDSQSGVGFPKGTFQLCFHTKDYWSTLFETWSIISVSGRSNLIWWNKLFLNKYHHKGPKVLNAQRTCCKCKW